MSLIEMLAFMLFSALLLEALTSVKTMGSATTFHEKKRIFLPATGCPAGEEVAGCVLYEETGGQRGDAGGQFNWPSAT